MPVHAAKLLLTMAGIAAFFVGTRTDFSWLRWSGIVLVAAAFLLRFYRPSDKR
ncbi:MAG TPA: hypothetical protein PLY94_09220 [Gemmatimonadaceae bacterium]|nr:hypothetical protein [Gemmatimonadaceae bacterium]